MRKRKELDSWFLMRHTWPIVAVLACYASFIYIDLKHLKNRKPINLKFVMLLFNIYQVVTNAQIVYLGLIPDIRGYLYNHACHPADPSNNPLWSKGFLGGRLFLISKLADMLDTIFIVLRKKESQVSFLHLYHHFSMVLFAWYCLKFTAGEQLIIILTVNPLVHVIMYSYYALSLSTPSIRKYLCRWKKYVTLLQLAQFVVYMGYMAAIVLLGCNHSKPLTAFVFLQSVIFFELFRNFYNKTYNKTELSTHAASENKMKTT